MAISPYQREFIAELEGEVAETKTIEDLMKITRLNLPLFTQEWIRKAAWNSISIKLRSFKRPTKKVAVLDVSQHVHAVWHTEPDVSKQPSKIVDRMERMIDKVAPDSVIYAFDSRNPFRRDMFPEFKGSREKKPDSFHETISLAMKLLDGKMVVLLDTYESDDIMASAATTGAILGDEVVLCTNDRDMWQVLGPKVKMFHDKFFTREDLKVQHGITPDQAVDWMCMVGKNDCPSLEGIGPKKATALLSKYGDMLGIMDAVQDKRDDIPKADWEEWKKTYYQVRPLYKLVRNIEIPYPY